MILEFFVTYYLIFTRPVSNDNVVDLRPYFPKVFDQSTTNSCTAQAITAVANYHERKMNKTSKLISRLDLYHQSRENTFVDGGATFEKSMNVIEHNGLCDETLWPYSSGRVKSNPPKRCVNNRIVHTDLKPFRIPSNAQCIAYAVRNENPVIIGVLLTPSFSESDKTVPMTEPIIAKHAMVVVGVTENDERFVLRNSWSTKWKSNGHITVSRFFIDRYITNSWILTPL